jgi:hypothetical protein
MSQTKRQVCRRLFKEVVINLLVVIKKRTANEAIEAEESHRYEHVYVKFPGQDVVPITLSSEEINVSGGRAISVKEDNAKLASLWKIHNRKRYTHIHTHPYSPEDPKYKDKKIKYSPLPSEDDLNRFLGDDSVKRMLIAQVNRDTNKPEGYFVLGKSKSTKPIGYSPLDREEFMEKTERGGIIRGIGKIIGISYRQRRVRRATKKYGKEVIRVQRADTPKDLFPLVEEIAGRHNLQYGFVPEKGYMLDKNKTGFIQKPLDLEGKVEVTTAIIGLFGSIFFLSFNLTGNVISDLSIKTSNLTGIVLFLVGLVAAFLYFRKK